MTTKLIQRHELDPEYEPSKLTDEDYSKLIEDINEIITDNKDNGFVKIVFTISDSVNEAQISDGHFFNFSDVAFESAYKRFKKDLKKSDYNTAIYDSWTGVYYAVFEIDWR